ncbi:MAG: alpha/beta fold hydrolase, partial [Dehalococcoidia bacterium]
MEPRVQYATTQDGISIALWSLGEGMPLVQMPDGPFSHLELEWQLPEYQHWYGALTRSRRIVRYDGRGSGLSERKVADFSLEARLLDLEAIVLRLGLERFDLLASTHSGPVAIAYAARHPEMVSHLILWSSYARGSDFSRSPAIMPLRSLIERDWWLFTETVAHAFLGLTEGDVERRFAAYMRECATPEAAQAAFGAANEADVTELLPQVQAPTLVLHRRQLRLLEVDVARHLAAGIPDARLVLLEGESISPFVGDTQAVLEAIEEFLGGATAPVPWTNAVAPAGGLRTVLFTDVEGSTGLTQRLGDARARDVMREHERIVRKALRAHGGSEVKALGDGLMASFSSA